MDKESFVLQSGLLGGAIILLFGGWSSGLTTLVIFMGIDFLAGLTTAMCGKSTKSADGKLLYDAGVKGFLKKGAMMLVVIVAYRLDLIIKTGYLLDAVVVALIVNETISILENLGAMGVPIPAIIRRVLTALNDKVEEKVSDRIVNKITREDDKGGGSKP
jgi:toxin secretion/phage lysis holin